MSIEFPCPTILDQSSLQTLQDVLRSHERYVVVPSDQEHTLSLRHAETPPRSHWPADIDLHFGDRLVVAFHAATQQQQQAFLDLLTKTLSNLGYPFTPEED